MGFFDFAGSTIVHGTGGWVGLVGAIILGPRIGRYGPDGKSRVLAGHNIPLAALGVFILWFGWFGFNPGSQLAASGTENAMAIALITINTNLAAAAGAISSHVPGVGHVRQARPYHVHERRPGRPGGHHRALRRGQPLGRHRHRPHRPAASWSWA